MKNIKTWSAESVSVGHPDCYMDYIVNSCLDEVLKQDPGARFACDGLAKNEFITLGGEVTTTASVNYAEVVSRANKEVGYEWEPEFINQIFTQSPDIAQGTNDDMGENIGAGDQGTISGYACNETEDYYPLAKGLADEVLRELFTKFKLGEFKWAKADMKSQITVDYTGEKPTVTKVVIACSHADDYIEEEFKAYIKKVCADVFAKYNVNHLDADYIINGTGKFSIYGPIGDSGECGRKIVVDAYGLHPLATVGGGTFNGKDSTKVDRTAAYYTRYVAKNIVAAGLADECRIDVAYCIGIAEPMSVVYNFNGTEKVPAERIEEIVNSVVSYKPANMRKLVEGFHDYATAGFISHFGKDKKHNPMNGKDVVIPWEQLDLVDQFKSLI